MSISRPAVSWLRATTCIQRASYSTKHPKFDIEAGVAAAKSLTDRWDNPVTLECGMMTLTLRLVETYKLVAKKDLGVEEICAKLRPPPKEPLAGSTVANYLLCCLEDVHFHDHEAALFRHLGKQRIESFISEADKYHWIHNGFGGKPSNRKRFKELWGREKERQDLLSGLRAGKIDPDPENVKTRAERIADPLYGKTGKYMIYRNKLIFIETEEDQTDNAM